MVIAFALLMFGYWPLGGLAAGELFGAVVRCPHRCGRVRVLPAGLAETRIAA